jgi:uncharacterized protein YceH (UPF0502 family)
LRSRTNRLCEFSDVEQVEATLKVLMAREDGPFIARLARAAGARESRYTHLFSGSIESAPEMAATAPHESAISAAAASSVNQRLSVLEELVAKLRLEIDELKEAVPPRAPEL